MKKTIISLCSAAAIAAVLISTAACSAEGGGGVNDGGGGGSQGGSMARFTISGDGNYLYTVDNKNLKVTSVSNPDNPIFIRNWEVGWDIETIFSMDNLLFIGSMGAMYIFDISNTNAERPVQLSRTNHFRSCDPVVAYDNLAFVTLNSSIGSQCGQRGNVLQIYDITEPSNIPQNPLFQTNMESPRGLSVDGERKLVFVCVSGGVEVWDFTNPESTKYLGFTARVPELEHISAYDCIALPGVTPERDGKLLTIGADGLYQIAYKRVKDDADNDKIEFTFLSKIDIRKE